MRLADTDRETLQEIRDKVYDMHGDVQRIDQHLDELNGSVQKNATSIEDNRGDISELDSKVKRRGWIWAGVSGTIGAIIATAGFIWQVLK